MVKLRAVGFGDFGPPGVGRGVGALFPIVCPFCHGKTAAAPEMFVRWRPPAGRSEAAESLLLRAPVPAEAWGIFSAVCAACDQPVFLELKMRGETLADLLPRHRTPARRAVGRLEANEVSECRVVTPKPPPGPNLPPSAPEKFLKTLRPLWEDAEKGRNDEGVSAGCRWLLLDVLKDIGVSAAPRRGVFGGKPEEEKLGPRLRAACEAGLLPRWAQTRAEAIEVDAKTRGGDPKAYVAYVAAVMRAAYPGF